MQKRRIQTAVGQRMEEAAISAGLSKKQIADDIGKSLTSIHRYWTGERRPDEKTMEEYAQVVGVSSDYLWNGVEAEELDAPSIMSVFEPAPGRPISNTDLIDQIEALLDQVRERLGP